MPTTHLRRLAVYVDEPEPQNFYWVMIESRDDPAVWGEVKASTLRYSAWIDAHNAGNLELIKRTLNMRSGPRAAGEDESANPVG